jgi:hypothetical protein
MADRILTEEEAHDGLLQEYSDVYKADAGFRPSLGTLHMLGNMELYAEVQKLYARAEESAEWEAEQARLGRAARAEAKRRIREIRVDGCGPIPMGSLEAALREAL